MIKEAIVKITHSLNIKKRQNFSRSNAQSNLIYTYHRIDIEQKLLRNKHICLDLAQKYRIFLSKTAEFQRKYIGEKKLTIFNSYARPITVKFPEEAFTQSWIATFVEDQRQAGFAPFLDLDPGFSPTAFMKNGIMQSDFVFLFGSKSLMEKHRYYASAYIKEELALISQRLEKVIQGKEPHFLFPIRLTGTNVKECYPPFFLGGVIAVHEFSDSAGYPLVSYLQMLYTLMRSIFKTRVSELALMEWESIYTDLFSEETFFPLHRHCLDESTFHKLKHTVIQKSSLKSNLEKRMRVFEANFIGRQKELEWLDKKIFQHKKNCVVIHGLGGFGKTHLVSAWVTKNKHVFRHIIWFNADTVTNLDYAVQNLASELNLTNSNLTPDSAHKYLKEYFANESDCLIIFDDAQDYDTLKKYLPNSDYVSVLITSAFSRWPSTFECYELGKMEIEDAVQLLQEITEKKNPHESFLKVAKLLDCIPLALRQAGTYIKECHISLNDYIERLKDSHFTDIETLLPSNQTNCLSTVWNMTLEKISSVPHYGNLALQLLGVCGYLAPNKIPFSLLKNVIGKIKSPFKKEPHALSLATLCDKIVGLLCSHSILFAESEQSTEEECYFHINPLMQQLVRKRSPLRFNEEISAQYTNANYLLQSLTTQIAYNHLKMETWVKNLDLVPHAEAFLKHALRLETLLHERLQISQLCYTTAQLHCHQSAYEESLYWYERAKEAINPESIMHHFIEHGMGQVYLVQHRGRKDYIAAEYHLIRAKEKAEIYSANTRVGILNDLARLYYDIGEYNHSKISSEEALAICEKESLSKKSIAYILHDLAMANLMLDNITEANIHITRSLNLKKSEYEKQIVPTIAATQLLEGHVYYLKKQFEAAKVSMELSLNISRECFPEEMYPKSHTGVGAGLNDLGIAYFKLNQPILALKYCTESAMLYLGLVNTTHTLDLNVALHNIAAIILSFKKNEHAAQLLYYAYDQCVALVGDHHKISLRIKKTLNLYCDTKDIIFEPINSLFELDIEERNTRLKNIINNLINIFNHNTQEVLDFLSLDLILSTRYGFFRTAPNNFNLSEQEINLMLSAT